MIRLRNLRKLATALLKQPSEALWFLRCYQAWQQKAPKEWQADLNELRPMLGDRHSSAGSARGHYFLQDIWAAQHVYKYQAGKHVDVASRLDGFVGHVLSFCPVEYVDIRPLTAEVPGLSWVSGSICELPFPDRSVTSLSCLHVIEHIGLGRYGDPVDPESWTIALAELSRVLAPGGQLLIGTPCGRPRTIFHAHRIFSPEHIISALPDLRLVEFSIIADDSASGWVELKNVSEVRDLDYGCGLFRFTREADSVKKLANLWDAQKAL